MAGGRQSRPGQSAKLANAQSLECITFVVQPSRSHRHRRTTADRYIAALRTRQRLETRAGRDAVFSPPTTSTFSCPTCPMSAPYKPKPAGRELAATRISIDFEGETCRYSALTDGAAIAERVITIDPRRLLEINNRLLAATERRRTLPPGKIPAGVSLPPRSACAIDGQRSRGTGL